VVAATFIVRNESSRALQLESNLILPAGWQPIASEMPFELRAGATAVRLISFVVPQMAQAGNYAVTYAVRDPRAPNLRATYTVRVAVAAALALQVLPIETPDYVIEGESYDSSFLLRNLGNAPLVVQYKARSAQGNRTEPREGACPLAPGESKRLTIKVHTVQTRRRESEDLTLIARVTGSDITDSATSFTQVVPRVSRQEAYRTLATQLDLRTIASERDGRRASAWQPQLIGAGALDDSQSYQINFRLRGPDTRDRGPLGETDDYWLQYRHDAFVAAVGDDDYGLSMLTEPGRYGRGALLGYQADHWGMTGYQMLDRLASQPLEREGFNSYFAPSEQTRVDFNLLRKETESASFGTVQSLRGRTQWPGNLSTDIELGRSADGDEHGNAVRAVVHGIANAVRYYAVGWRADRQFSGYLRDKEYFNTGFDYQRTEWAFRGYYRVQDWNLELPKFQSLESDDHASLEDFIRAAPTERQATLGVDRSFAFRTRVSLDYSIRNRHDPSAQPALDVGSQSARLGLGRSWKDLSLLYSIERGQTQNERLPGTFGTSLQILSAAWRISEAQSYSLYALRDDNAFANEPGAPQTTFGLSASYELGAATSLSFEVQRDQSEESSGTSLNFSLSHESPSGGRVSLLARRLEISSTQTDLMLTYSMPFGMPIGRKTNVGAVRGRVFDGESRTGVSNLLLNLDGLTAVTDRNGQFHFPVVPAGNHQLSVDRSRIEVGKVAAENLPLALDVTPLADREVQIALMRSVNIVVTVRLNPKRTDDPQSSKPVRAVPNTLITLKSGATVYRRLTDTNGIVQLGGLRPGRWLISISEEAIPADYSVENREVAIDLAPGASAGMDFVLTPVLRRMRMVAPPQRK
jgi:hypothetical protein